MDAPDEDDHDRPPMPLPVRIAAWVWIGYGVVVMLGSFGLAISTLFAGFFFCMGIGITVPLIFFGYAVSSCGSAITTGEVDELRTYAACSIFGGGLHLWAAFLLADLSGRDRAQGFLLGGFAASPGVLLMIAGIFAITFEKAYLRWRAEHGPR